MAKITRITEKIIIHLEYSASVEQLLVDNDIQYKISSVNRLEEIDEPESEEELELLKNANQDLRERMKTHRTRMKLPNIKH